MLSKSAIRFEISFVNFQSTGRFCQFLRNCKRYTENVKKRKKDFALCLPMRTYLKITFFYERKRLLIQKNLHAQKRYKKLHIIILNLKTKQVDVWDE